LGHIIVTVIYLVEETNMLSIILAGIIITVVGFIFAYVTLL